MNLVCALYGMDPGEINFPNRAGGVGSAPGLVSSSPEALRLTASKDKGLRTLLGFLERSINNHIMPFLDKTGDFEFSFQGFDNRTDTERTSLDRDQARTWKTVNEIRKDHGFEEIDNGDLILDSVYLQAKQAAQQGGGPEGLDNEDFASDTGDQEGATWKQGSSETSEGSEGQPLW